MAEATEQLPTEVEHFAALALGSDDGAAFAYVEEQLAKGSTVESIFLDLLAPAARQLGTLWESDAADFANVTLGVGRLQLIMRRLSDRFTDETNAFHAGELVLLTIIPGEQHSFGLIDGGRVLPARRLEFVYRPLLVASGTHIACA